jgi:hypothetical protein
VLGDPDCQRCPSVLYCQSDPVSPTTVSRPHLAERVAGSTGMLAAKIVQLKPLDHP